MADSNYLVLTRRDCSLRNVWKDFRLLMSSLATATGKSLNCTAKLIFQSSILCYHRWCWHRKSKQSLSIHYLIIFGPYACEIWTKSYGLNCIKVLSFLTIMVDHNHFWQVFTQFECLKLNYWFKDTHLSVLRKAPKYVSRIPFHVSATILKYCKSPVAF